jgi:hypothetical protein
MKTEPPAPDLGAIREHLGQHVRAVWITWAAEQPNPKPSWLVPWEALSEADREVDRRIGEALYQQGYGQGYDAQAARLAAVEQLNTALQERMGLYVSKRTVAEIRAELELKGHDV